VIIKKEKINKNKSSQFFYKIYFYITLILAIIFLTIFFKSGLWNNIKLPFLDRVYSSSINNYLNIFDITIKSIKGNFIRVPELNIDISFNNIIKIENDRNEVNKISSETRGDAYEFTNINVKLSNDVKKYNANLRIKGDRKIHFEEKKNSSYKIELKNNTLFGLRKFSIMKPRARNYIHEWLFHELLEEGKLITLKYDFIDLNINGSSQGLYVLEEGFDKILIERNKRRNGPIFSLEESFSTQIEDAKLEVYNKKNWLNDSNIDLTKIAASKLRLFFDNEVKSEEFMDLDKWAWFLAVSDINNYNHGLEAKSVKFYYNPISGFFEPIGFDGHRTYPNYSKYYLNWEKRLNKYVPSSFEAANRCKDSYQGIGKNKCNKFIYNFFYDSNESLNLSFYKKYRKAVLKISSKEFLDNFFKKRNKEIDKINSKIYSDYFFVDHINEYGPGLYYFNKKDFYIRSQILINSIKSKPEKVFFQQDKQKIKLVNRSINNNDLFLQKLKCYNNNNIERIFNLSITLDKNVDLSDLIDLTKMSKSEKLYCSEIEMKNLSNNFMYIKKIDLLNNKIDTSYEKNYTQRYIKYFRKNKNLLTLINDKTIIKENILIPSGYEILIKSGQEIFLTDNAFIFSNSPWTVDGIEDEIKISGLIDNFGGGLIIKNAPTKSLFHNVKISYLAGLKNYTFDKKSSKYLLTKTMYHVNKKNSYNEKIFEQLNFSNIENQKYRIYGAINFLESEVEMNNVKFEKINSEDALNIIKSDFYLDNIFFSEIGSDAIDVDFGIGIIKNSSFINILDDAVDFSGSTAELNNLKMNNVGDKMVSIGEKSTLKISNLTGNQSKIGIANKDGSFANIKNIIISNSEVAIAAYKKKNEYTGSTLVANNVIISDSNLDFLVDSFSKITLEDKLIIDNNTNIEKIKSTF